ncbi:MAG: hypothetical protein AAF907_00270 [Planctomycetota bacterium]
MTVPTYRSGPTQMVRAPSDPAYAIRPGMLVGLFSGVLRPPSGTPWADEVNATRELFSGSFLGVAHTSSEVGESETISVDISPMAVYAPAVEPGGVALGTPLGPADAGGALSDDLLAPVGNRERAIALAMETVSATETVVRVGFASAFNPAANHTASMGRP